MLVVCHDGLGASQREMWTVACECCIHHRCRVSISLSQADYKHLQQAWQHMHTHTPIQAQRSCLIPWRLVALKLLLTGYTGVTSSLSVPLTAVVGHEDCQRAAATLTTRKIRESVLQMMLFVMSCCLLKYPVFRVIYTCFCPGQDERASCHSSGCIRGAMATGGTGLGLIQWSGKAWCFDTCRGCVGVCDVRWSASTGWPSMRSCSDYHACRHGAISCVNALHVKPCFHCRVPFSMTWTSATSMKIMRSLFSCPRHGTGNLNQLAGRTWPR